MTSGIECKALLLSLIIGVAAFNIVASLVMVVTDKIREIGILRAMGLTAKDITRIFVLQGVVIGFIGTALGTILGLILSLLLKRYKFITLPGDVYFVDKLPVDLNLPDVDGTDGLARLRARLSDTPIVVISSYDDDSVVSRVLRSGAVGFISKKSGGSELEAALRQIWNGETCVPAGYRAVAEASGDEAPEDAVARMKLLTPQQLRILMLVSDGRLNKQIAGDLSIAETTVKAHLTVIMRKLKVQSRTQAALIAQRAQLEQFRI